LSNSEEYLIGSDIKADTLNMDEVWKKIAEREVGNDSGMRESLVRQLETEEGNELRGDSGARCSLV